MDAGRMRQDPIGRAAPRKQGFGWRKSLALVPILLFIVLISYFEHTDPVGIVEPPYLLLTLNSLFTTIIPFTIAYLSWRSYSNSGQWRFFLTGCGMVALGFGSLVAGFVINVPGGVNVAVAAYNMGAMLGAIFICTAAVFSVITTTRYKLVQNSALYLGLYYCAVMVFISLFTIAVYQQLIPPFFVQGKGPTILRQLVLGTAAVLFAASSIIFLRVYLRSRADFTYWLSTALILISIGLFTVFLQTSVGGLTGWAGRAAQYLGCIYLLIGIVAAYRISITKKVSLVKEFAQSFNYIEANYKTLVEMASDAILSVDEKGTILTWNQAAIGIFGYSAAEAAGGNVEKLIFPRETALLINVELQNLIKTGSKPSELGSKIESMALRKDGEQFPVEVSMAMKKVTGEWLGTFIIRDMTQRKRAEEALQKAEERFRRVSQISTDIAYSCVTGQDGAYYIDWLSGAVEQTTGYTVDEIMAKSCWRFLVIEEDVALFEKNVIGLTPGQSASCDLRITGKSGQVTWVSSTAECVAYYENSKLLRLYGGLSNITARKKAEESILRSKVLLQSVIDSTPDWMYVKDFQHKFLLVNRSFAEAQNARPQDMIDRPDTDFFSDEMCRGNPEKGISGFHADDNQAFQGRMVHNPRNLGSWADGSQHIYDTYKIPLADQSGKIYAALAYSRDITDQIKAEDEREVTFIKIQKTLHDVINTMAKIVEMRDPYTSGHQGRVASLAGAIAMEMKLDDSRVEHLMMAASIHDVGKMYVPADILSKPGELLDIEWAMIKTHVQGSYEILKDVEFSQPIALMALQHHERLDGSGYPNGLKGDEMLLESKILAVADLVEAMSSHRPYRPALGIEKALDEILVNKGVLYDPDVVDFCVALFRKNGFQFDG